MEPGRVTFDDKMVVRKAIEKAGIPFTYVSANCFAGYFLGGLCQPAKQLIPSTDSVVLLGDGNQKGTSQITLFQELVLFEFQFDFYFFIFLVQAICNVKIGCYTTPKTAIYDY